MSSKLSGVAATHKAIRALLVGGSLTGSPPVLGGRVKDSTATPYIWIEPPNARGDRTSGPRRGQTISFVIHVFDDSESPATMYSLTSQILALLDPTGVSLMSLDSPFVHYGHPVPIESYEQTTAPNGGIRQHSTILFEPWVQAT